MAIKDLYNESEKEKGNKIKDSSISMSREDFISEHKNLIKILRSGDRKAQEAEAAKQEKELAEEAGEEMQKEEEDEEEGDDEDKD
jgi:hypothetical protein